MNHNDLRFLPGVGPARADALARAGIRTVADLLYRVPRFVAMAPAESSGDDLPRGAPVQVRARVASVKVAGFGRKRILEVRATTSSNNSLRVRFFNAMYLRDKLIPNEWYLFEGKTDARQRQTLNHPRFTHLSQGDHDSTEARSGADLAYPLPDGISADLYHKLVNHCLDHESATLSDPAGLVDDGQWQAVITQLHRPADAAAHEQARRALAERECMALAWLLQERRRAVTALPGTAWRWSEAIDQRARARLPFTLTPGQEAALAEIRADLQAPTPMYRLLQGDVGSGKTAVALLAALAVVADGAQALILAPTAVLAEQHRQFFERCLSDSRVRLASLTGGTNASERRSLLADLAGGKIHIVIGTHALLEDDVHFARLGLAVIDEQHKFGVGQRARAIAGEHASQPDLLVLTATPIPRTLTLTLFGDLAVSSITDKPPGRAATTTSVEAWSLPALHTALDDCLACGGRAYVVTPLRDESDKIDAADASTIAAELRKRYHERVGLVHGALDESAKQVAITAFRDGHTPILVATTVIEVGMDVPAATLMVVINAERFGLAQLHQLRGRVGRGEQAGRCILYTSRADARERIAILTETDDGFRIAEADLAERGPGEILGTRQHGLPRLIAANLLTDTDLLQGAHEHVRRAFEHGESMPNSLRQLLPEHADEALAGA